MAAMLPRKKGYRSQPKGSWPPGKPDSYPSRARHCLWCGAAFVSELDQEHKKFSNTELALAEHFRSQHLGHQGRLEEGG